MGMGERPQEAQRELWIPTQDIVKTEGHPFYARLNQVLAEHGFDAFAVRRCKKFYQEDGRPGVPVGVYFRMLMVGYFEGLDSERGIAWRCEDSLSLRRFLGYALTEATPEHSTLSVIRNRIDLRTHKQVFKWVVLVLAKAGLVKGKTVGVDATTLVANAAMKSIVQRETGQKYEEFLLELARNAGIEDPTREDLAKLDRKRKKKGSNKDWFNPHDPDAKITKLKDGRTHLAHKDEHAVDMATGAVLAVTVQPANRDDRQSLPKTLDEAQANLRAAARDVEVRRALPERQRPKEWIEEVVADKGYHSNAALVKTQARTLRTYIAEPDYGRRDWEGQAREQAAVYANRRRVRGKRGKHLMRKRGELIERPFAHALETGGMRRVFLRGHEKILKRLLIHMAGLNLGLLMRKVFGVGTPRTLQGREKGLFEALFTLPLAWIITIVAKTLRRVMASQNFRRLAAPNAACAA